jgi:hypothetical protein
MPSILMTKIGVILWMPQRDWRDIQEQISISHWDIDDGD